MIQIKLYNDSNGVDHRFALLRRRLAGGIKWWAEHQAWPATDEIRIDRQRPVGG